MGFPGGLDGKESALRVFSEDFLLHSLVHNWGVCMHLWHRMEGRDGSEMPFLGIQNVPDLFGIYIITFLLPNLFKMY